MRRISPFLVSVLWALPLAAQLPGSTGPSLHLTANARIRGEAWAWFPVAAPVDGNYAMVTSLLRLGVTGQSARLSFAIEGAAPLLVGVPGDAVAPAPQGQLGFGGSARLANGTAITDLFLKQAFVRVALSPSGHAWSARLGRFEFGDGRDDTTKDPTLVLLKQERVADRLIGSFGFSPIGRSFDGIDVSGSIGRVRIAALMVHPTQGVFRVDGMPELAVDLAYAALSATPGALGHDDARLFGVYYGDRRTVLKVDNRAAGVRALDTDRIRVATIGGHYLATGRVGGGRGDLLLWGAWQFGRWGVLRQSASAEAFELGFRPGASERAPWIRAGLFHSSGDHHGTDGAHNTFFQVLPTPRPYARFPFFNLMNLEEAFLSLRLTPARTLALRSDLHLLRLSAAEDLWYSGGGAFEPTSFGYAGRPSGGGRNLARLLDLSAELRLAPTTSLNGYLAHAVGGDVIGASYPRGHHATFGYIELLQRF